MTLTSSLVELDSTSEASFIFKFFLSAIYQNKSNLIYKNCLNEQKIIIS